MGDVNTLKDNNLGSIAGRSPKGGIDGVRGWIRNLVMYGDDYAASKDNQQPDTMEFWFRPNPITEVITVNYDDMAPMGMSHAYQVFKNTTATQWTFDIFWNALMMLGNTTVEQNISERNYSDGQAFLEGKRSDLKQMGDVIEQQRRFLQALTVPPELADGTIYEAPAPCLLVVPGIVSQRVRLRSVTFVYTNNDINGNIKEARATCEFREAPLGRFTMQDVIDNGATRIWGL